MKIYGSEICIDCRNILAIYKNRNIDFEFIDITLNTTNLKEFLSLRDSHSLFEPVKSNGGIGIPCFVEDGRMTLDENEAMRWIHQPEIKEEEIIEKR